MLKRVLLLALLLSPLLLLSQTAQEIKTAYKNRDKYLFAVEVEKKNFTETIDFTDVKNKMIIPVIIAGETYHFVFDTGAVTVISTELKEKLKPKVLYSGRFEDASGITNSEDVFNIGDVQIGSVKFNSVAAVSADLSKLEKRFCVKLDGLIGTNLMRTCNWKIDYINNKLLFSDEKIKPIGNYTKIDFSENFSGSPLLLAYIGDHAFYSIMDTGFGGAFSVPDSLFFKSSKSKELKLKRGFGRDSFGIYESAPEMKYKGVIDSIHIGEYAIRNIEINVDSSPPLIGNVVFKRSGDVIINWDSHKLYIANTVEIEEAVTDMNFGFRPLFVDGKIQIVMLWDDGDAKLKGVALGDVITAINDEDTKNITQERWCELLDLFANDDFIKIKTMRDDTIERSYELKKTNLFN